MKERHASAFGKGGIPGFELNGVWDVEADLSYDVLRHKQKIPISTIIIHTSLGRGELTFSNEKRLMVDEGTLIAVENNKLRRYRCVESNWFFWWFDTRITGPLPMPLYHKLSYRRNGSDQELFSSILNFLRQDLFSRRALANSCFAHMLYGWLDAVQIEEGNAQARRLVDKAVEMMYERLDGTLSMYETARKLGLSDRHFRKLFQCETGRSPKSFYDYIRMNSAKDMLRQQFGNVSEISERLGYCNPFHFSRCFKKHIGVSPSRFSR